MDRRLVSGLALVAGLAVAACTEQPQEQSLHEQNSVASFITPCNSNGFNSLIAGYFDNPQQGTVKGYKDAMLAALGANPIQLATAQTNGFNILREIALRAKVVPQPPAATGSELAVETLRCIVEVTDPEVIGEEPDVGFFIDALSHAAAGGFEVRGGTGDPTVPVQAVTGTPLKVISGIAPPAPQSTTWWNGSLDGQRVLFYGEPGTAGGYHWSVVPRDATFDPALVVTTCVDDEVTNDPSLMVTEENVGVLAFVDAGYIGCGGAPATASAGRFGLLRHFANLGRKLLLPEPAVATTVLPGIVGGAATKVKSLFNVDPVGTLGVALSTVPSPIGTLVVNKTSFALTVTATEDGNLVNGARVTLSLETNNGTTNSVLIQSANGACNGDAPSAVTGAGSFATGTVFFPKLCITKTGNVKVVVNVQVEGRSGKGLNKTEKIKVIPK